MITVKRIPLLWVAVVGVACPRAGVLVNDPAPDPDNQTTQSEPSLAWAGRTVVVGFNDSGQWPQSGSFTGFGYSTDGGASFHDAGALVPSTGGFSVGDAALGVDHSGTFFFATLAVDAASSSYIGVAKSTATSPGVSFGPPVLIPGLDPQGFQDKEALAIDNTGGLLDGAIYVAWTEFPVAGGSRILFARSTDHGATFSAPVLLSADGAAVSGAAVVVAPTPGPRGKLILAWENESSPTTGTIEVRTSGDGGVTWGTMATAATFTRLIDATATAACGRAAIKGPIRINEFPSLVAGRTDAYIAFAADPDGDQSAGDAADVYVVHSADAGASWGAPIDVNSGTAVVRNPDPTRNDNFLPSLALAQNGTVTVFFYDRRNDAANLAIDVYQATSTDGGATWQDERITKAPFRVPPLNPNFDPVVATCYMGDYNSSASEGVGFSVTWGDNGRTIALRGDPDVRFIEH